MARSRKKEAFGGCQTNLWGARVVRLGGSAQRAGLPLLKRTPRIPNPGQHVDLRIEDDTWRKGFRALSEPWTADTGEVMIWVATEDEYRAAGREGRSVVGVP